VSEFKGTPGPWSVCGLISGPVYIGAPRPGNAARMDDILVGGHDIANATLAAAAPDLLEALMVFVDDYVAMVHSGDAGFWDPEDEAKVIAARAAIKKALQS